MPRSRIMAILLLLLAGLPSAHGAPTDAGGSSILGKTVELEFETTGSRVVGSETTPFAPIREATKIKILQNGKIYLFASATATRGNVFELGKVIDVLKNPQYGDPTLFKGELDITIYKTRASLKDSVLTLATELRYTLKANGVELLDNLVQELYFPPGQPQCMIRRISLKVSVPANNLLQTQEFSRQIRCAVVD